jgi:hypothetical protein
VGVRPYQGPCYSCLYSQNVRREGSEDEEISQANHDDFVLLEMLRAGRDWNKNVMRRAREGEE